MSGRDRQLAAWNDTVQTRDQQFNLKRTALLKEAARAFSSQGYHATSLDDVAKTLGVTKPALYYYIKNKQEILFECHMLSQDLGDRAFDEHVGKSKLSGPMPRISHMLVLTDKGQLNADLVELLKASYLRSH